MSFDPSLYDRLVWKPATDGSGGVPDNIWILLGFPDLGGGLDDHISAVKGFWASKNKGRRQALVANFNKKLESANTAPNKIEEAKKQVLANAARRIEGLKASRSAMSEAERAALAERLPLPDRLVGELLQKNSISVVAAPELKPTPEGFRAFRQGTISSARTTLSNLYGTESPLEFKIIESLKVLSPTESIETCIDRVDQERKLRGTSFGKLEDQVFKEIKKAFGSGRYDDFLYTELVTIAREQKQASMGQRQIAEDLASLGLVPMEAELLSVAISEESAGPGSDPYESVVDELGGLMAGGRLREAARQLAPEYDKVDNEALKAVAARIKSQVAKVEELTRQAETAMSKGRTEEAALAWFEASELAKDDERLRSRLAAIAPPAPTRGKLTLRPDSTVHIQWEPSNVLVGTVDYRVVRHTHRPTTPTDGQHIKNIEGQSCIDAVPPAAIELHYAVFTERAGGPPSPPLHVGSVFATPEVSSFKSSANAESVSAHWKTPERATQITVTRKEDRAPTKPGDGQNIPLDGVHGFVDRSVVTGTRYHYLISVTYAGTSGGVVTTDGIEFSVRPQIRPEPVIDLIVQPDSTDVGADEILLEWSNPTATGDVRILRSTLSPDFRPRQQVDLAKLSGLGDLFPGTTDRDGIGTARIPSQSGTVFFTAVTMGYDGAIVGKTIQWTDIKPVQDLRVERFQDECRVQWIWPAGASSALVRCWPTGGQPSQGQEIEISKRQYHDEGARLKVGRGPVEVQVQACADGPKGKERSRASRVELAGMSTGTVEYGLRRKRLRKQATLWFKSAQSVELALVTVIWSPDNIIPTSERDGQPIANLSNLTLSGASEYEYPIDLGELPKNARWIACFSNQPGVELLPHERQQLRLSKS